ncbi:MAG: type 4a pilus biogenesis protein PilO [Candidatus Omnitrophota bacterium]
MGLLKKYSAFFMCFIALLLVGSGVYLDKTLIKQTEALTNEINTKRDKLQKYYSDVQNAPSPYRVSRLTREKLTLEGNYETLASRYAGLSILTLPADEIFPPLYYKETMYLLLDDLRSEAVRANVSIPSSLGITETGLPSAEEVPTLFIMLDTVKRLCEEVFRSKLSTLSSIQIGKPVTNPLYIEIPLTISISDTSSRVAYFYQNLGSSQSIFVLEHITMTRSGDKVDASLNLKRLIWSKELSEKTKIIVAPTQSAPQQAMPGGGPPGMPGGPPGPPR